MDIRLYQWVFESITAKSDPAQGEENMLRQRSITIRVTALFAILFMIAGGGFASHGTASAQQGNVRQIPVAGMGFGSALSPDGKTLVTFEDGNLHSDEVDPLFLPLRLVNLDTGAVSSLGGNTDYAASAAWSGDGKLLVSYHDNGVIMIWDAANAKELKRMRALPGRSRIALSADGKTLVTQVPGVVLGYMVWDLESGTITAILTQPYDTYKQISDTLQGGNIPDSATTALALSPDGHTLAAASGYGNIFLWDVASGKMTQLVTSTATLPMLSIRFVTFTGDGATLIYADTQDGTLHFLDVATGHETNVIQANTHAAPAITPDGHQVAWVDFDSKAIMVWDAAQPDSPQTVASIPDSAGTLQPSPLGALYFTPDATRLVLSGFIAGDANNYIWVFDLTQ
jgi:WD40 repeat protein